jgi:hypothetical protein
MACVALRAGQKRDVVGVCHCSIIFRKWVARNANFVASDKRSLLCCGIRHGDVVAIGAFIGRMGADKVIGMAHRGDCTGGCVGDCIGDCINA